MVLYCYWTLLSLLHLCLAPVTICALSLPLQRLDRRSAVGTVTSAVASVVSARPVVAVAVNEENSNNNKQVFVQGFITLAPDTSTVAAATTTSTVQDVQQQEPTTTNNSPLPALYITCRPNVSDNIPAAILSGTRGKAPPVLVARFESPIFPYAFQLNTEHLTAEGAYGISEEEDDDDASYWWTKDDLIVSARWDEDGVAATRSPEDLVGRAIFLRNNNNGNASVMVQLQGRGSFGKFATKKN